jgi:hypothetical protein
MFPATTVNNIANGSMADIEKWGNGFESVVSGFVHLSDVQNLTGR